MKNFLDDLMKKHRFKMFEKKDRSSFEYWYYHWKAFNLVAYYLGIWKFKYLFHDIEKPWLRLFLPYEKVQKWHRTNNKHHSQYKGGLDKVDWDALIIDNECSRFTKVNSPLNAREYVYYVVNEKENVSYDLRNAYYLNCFNILDKLGL